MGVLLESKESEGGGEGKGRMTGERGARMDGRGGEVLVELARWWPTNWIGEGAMAREGVKASQD